MNEITHFLEFLKRRLPILVLVPLVAMAVCYYFTRTLPDTYLSQGRIATGLVDRISQIVISDQPVQGSEIDRSFDNLIQLMKMKKVMDRVAQRLLVHDLTAPRDSAFRPPSETLAKLDAATKQRIAAMLTNQVDSLPGGASDKLYEARISAVNGMAKEMGYNPAALLEKLIIERLATSDYLEVTYEAEDPRLTAFVVNALLEEFQQMYTRRLLQSSNRSVMFFNDLVQQKRNALNGRMDALKNYKIRNNVLNLDEQANGLYGHILDFETRRELAKKDVVAYQAALKNIDQRFNPKDRRYMESAMAEANQKIARISSQLKSVNDQYIQSNFDPRLKSRVDSLQENLNQLVRSSTEESAYSPLSAKADLVSRKLEMEIALELAQSSIASIDAEVNRLDEKYKGMVPDEASIQQLEASIEIASKEYTDALQQYNDARLESYSPAVLSIAERAGPGELLPSKKLILVLLAGIAALALCLFIFSATYFMDNAVRTALQLANATGLPVLGQINSGPEGRGLRGLEDLEATDESTMLFKDLVRSIRFELDEEAANPKVIAITSLHDQAGKTDLMYGLAWAYARINQRVLIVDGNFNSPTISRQSAAKADVSDYFNGEDSYLYPEQVDYLSTTGGDISLLEIAEESKLREKIAHLKEQYDVVLIETPALTASNKAKEWMGFADKIVAVFGYGGVLKDEDKIKVEYLRSRGPQLSGWVLSRVDKDTQPMGKTRAKI